MDTWIETAAARKVRRLRGVLAGGRKSEPVEAVVELLGVPALRAGLAARHGAAISSMTVGLMGLSRPL